MNFNGSSPEPSHITHSAFSTTINLYQKYGRASLRHFSCFLSSNMSLRSILGGSSRVRKSSKGSGAKRSSSSSSPSLSPSLSPSQAWASSLPRRKPGTSTNKQKAVPHDDGDDLFGDKLDDYGLVRVLATDLNLRDTSQAIRYIRTRMFSAIPEQAAGMNSTRIAEVLNYRKNLPPIVTVPHVQTLLSSPSAVEREIAELARSGFVRKVVVARRGDIGETVMLASDYEKMIKQSTTLRSATRESLLAYLEKHPGAQIVSPTALRPAEINDLIQAGFVTAHSTAVTHHGSMSNMMNLYSRPEDRGTLTSLEMVSRQPTGSLGAVGGDEALDVAYGGGGGGRLTSSSVSSSSSAIPGAGATELRLAVPGNGTFLKLLSTALDHLVALLGRSRFREAPETVLRDRWDGGVAREDAVYAAGKRARGEFAGILPGQSRKWRQFYGLSFDWVLQEAVGSGLVEVFETGSVGRGIRAT
ncbi:serine-threonine protein kinase 19-domain-containing protein [Xylariomycetidae sp. FL2044]|nr:serine-threonine protein kinase 19-domain-containing protein [Xylariomycetidae sp. FL2044]